VLGGLAILGVIAWRLGTGPFLDGVEAVGPNTIALAALITCVTTAACAWRWRVVARGLGAELSVPGAIAGYYRSQFLNTVLPGGILGDVHRGVHHGRSAGDLSRGLRAVAWERIAGQVVQLGVAVLVIAVLPSPVRSTLPFAVGGAAVVALLLAAAARFAPRTGISRTARAWRVACSDVRHGLLPRRAWPVIATASVIALAGHVSVFVLAAHAAGVHAPLRVLLPLAVVVMVGASLPTNVGGWGPREGVAAWAFAAAGQGAGHGVAAATAFGVLMVIATLPGAIAAAASVRGPAAPEHAAVGDRGLAGARNS
jgi:uncharacterized membrane protein YbhN (UPF0104 family)